MRPALAIGQPPSHQYFKTHCVVAVFTPPERGARCKPVVLKGLLSILARCCCSLWKVRFSVLLSTGRAGLDPAELLLKSGLLPMFDSNPRCSASGSFGAWEFEEGFLLLAGPLLLLPFALACVGRPRLCRRGGCCFCGGARGRAAGLHARGVTCAPPMLQ